MKTLKMTHAISEDRDNFVADIADRQMIISYAQDKSILITASSVLILDDGTIERRYERIAISPLALVGLSNIANMVLAEPKFMDMMIQQMESIGYEFPKPEDETMELEKEHQLRSYRGKK